METAIKDNKVKFNIAQAGVPFNDFRDSAIKVRNKKELVITFTLNSKLEGATLTLETSEIKSEPVLVPTDSNHPQYKERREKNLKLEVK